MKKNRTELLAKTSITEALITLSLPATIAMTINALYNIIDTIFVGKYVGDLGIAGLTIAFPIQMLVLGIASMFGMGAASLISRQLGAKKINEANKTISSMVFWNFIIIVIFSVLGYTFMKPVLTLFGSSETIYPYAEKYMRIIYIGFIFFSFSVAANNTVRAEGRAVISMIAMISGALLNVILDFIFLGILKLGIEGAALATITSQFVSASILVFALFSKKSIIKFNIKNIDFGHKTLFSIVAIGISALFIQAGTSILAALLNKSLYFYGGDTAIATYGIINKVVSLLVLPIIGIRQGAQPIMGYNFGANNFKRVKETIRIALTFMIIYGFLSYLVVMIFTPSVIKIFGGSTDLLEMAIPALRIAVAAIFLESIEIMTSSIYQSSGRAIPALFTSIIRRFLLLIPFVLFLPGLTKLGLNALWIAFPLADFITFVICLILFIRSIKKLNKNEFSQTNLNIDMNI